MCNNERAAEMVETMHIDDETIQVRLGARIKARREQLGLSQSHLGELSGTHRTYVNQVENGRKNVTVGTLARIATALRTTPSTLTQGILDGSH
jgi:transcriptional regulator with XRE-family HTH domain